MRSAARITTQKSRAVCRRQQQLRVNIEQPAPLLRHRGLLLTDDAKGAAADSAALIESARGLV